MHPLWTLPELVAEAAARIAALPAPRNGQVRAIPDDRTVRYYATIGLLDRPSAMRGRTALYGYKHAAQIVAIKRLQAMGRSLSEIQALWATLDDRTLSRMSGVELEGKGRAPARAEFWKREPKSSAAADTEDGAAGAGDAAGSAAAASAAVASAASPAAAAMSPVQALGAHPALELRVELAPQVVLALAVVGESCAISPADVRAIRAAAAPLLAELASRRLASHPGGDEP